MPNNIIEDITLDTKHTPERIKVRESRYGKWPQNTNNVDTEAKTRAGRERKYGIEMQNFEDTKHTPENIRFRENTYDKSYQDTNNVDTEAKTRTYTENKHTAKLQKVINNKEVQELLDILHIALRQNQVECKNTNGQYKNLDTLSQNRLNYYAREAKLNDDLVPIIKKIVDFLPNDEKRQQLFNYLGKIDSEDRKEFLTELEKIIKSCITNIDLNNVKKVINKENINDNPFSINKNNDDDDANNSNNNEEKGNKTKKLSNKELALLNDPDIPLWKIFMQPFGIFSLAALGVVRDIQSIIASNPPPEIQAIFGSITALLELTTMAITSLAFEDEKNLEKIEKMRKMQEKASKQQIQDLMDQKKSFKKGGIHKKAEKEDEWEIGSDRSEYSDNIWGGGRDNMSDGGLSM